jgi:hypothetical protein
MQTVNFNCPHCGNLMAVGTNLLGRNVRCPHCKQVLRAPAAAGGAPAPSHPAAPTPSPPAPLPTFNVPRPSEHHESIFGERHDEDVFGSDPPKPTLPEVPRAASQLRALGGSSDEATVSMPTPPPPPSPEELLNFGAAAGLAPPPKGPQAYDGPAALQPPAPTPARPEDDVRQRRISVRDAAPPTQAFAWIMLAYALVATLLAGFFGYKYLTAEAADDHPFKAMPDVLREYDPAKKRQVSFRGLPDPKQDVPADLRVKLGQVLTLGDLEVRPTAVERRKLEAVTVPEVGNPKPGRSIGETVVLTLRVKNVSGGTIFCPTDPAFDRAADRSQPAPYTALEVQRSFFFGIFKWPPEPGTQKEFVVGHEANEQPLLPGEERDAWTAVAPTGVRAAADDIIRKLKLDVKATDWLLWRVQLRRGLVTAKGPDGTDMEVSATAVIGVEFRADQIKQ